MRIGTRRSALALAQAELIADLLGDCEIVPIVTSGDRARDSGGTGPEDKSRWIRELELALLSGEVDLAVHSAKDVPGELAAGLELLGSPARAAPEDALVGAGGIEELEQGARVGTSSLRRTAQLRAARGDLQPVPIRGNVDTRLRKLADGGADLQAIVLARAGLERLGLGAQVGAVLDTGRFVPAPGQGIIALEGRAGDHTVREAVHAITDPPAFASLLAERALAVDLEASCHTPLGAHAQPRDSGGLLLRAWIGLPDGSAWIADELLGELAAPAQLGRAVAARMRAAGGVELLRGAEEMAGVGGG
ncbi:MAG TPA: hydroxymethylbilane synthase [Solirubrobacteraceae bacterium]|jgi:hydroxymethylbilane synthase